MTTATTEALLAEPGQLVVVDDRPVPSGWRSSATFGELAKALLQFQAGGRVVASSREAQIQNRTYRYAPLDQVFSTIGRALADAELVIVQPISEDPETGDRILLSRVIHAPSSEWLESVIRLPRAEDIKQFGSSITYARRYALISLLGLAATEDDEDGGPLDPEPVRDENRKGANRAAAAADPPSQAPRKLTTTTAQRAIDIAEESGKRHGVAGSVVLNALLELGQLPTLPQGCDPDQAVEHLREHISPARFAKFATALASWTPPESDA